MTMNWTVLICVTVMISSIYGKPTNNKPLRAEDPDEKHETDSSFLKSVLTVVKDVIHIASQNEIEKQFYGINVVNLPDMERTMRSSRESKKNRREEKKRKNIDIYRIVLDNPRPTHAPEAFQDFKYPVKQALRSDYLDNNEIKQGDPKRQYYNFGKQNKLQNILRKLKPTNQPYQEDQTHPLVIVEIDPSKLVASKKKIELAYNNKNELYLRAQTDRPLNVSEMAKKATTIIKDFFHIDSTNKIITKMYGINLVNPDFLKDLDNNDTKKNNGPKNIKNPKRRNMKHSGQLILGVPRRPEHLPKAQPILPGHTLLRPARGMLKSSIKYPMRDFGGAAVYGNEDNLGITWGKTRHRVRYSDFRKANNLLDLLQNSVQSGKLNKKDRNRKLIVIEIDPSELGKMNSKGSVSPKQLYENEIFDEKNSAVEVFDELDATSSSNSNEYLNLRRARKSKYRDRKGNYKRKTHNTEEASKGSETSSSSSEVEKNPGNPHTIHKNKYKQNWMWNHIMDGDHMNINPLAPKLNDITPSGEDLFFARKWWYFNEDDFKPMG